QVTPGTIKTYTLTATGITGNTTASVTIAVDAPQMPPRINEMMAENDGSLADEDGTQADWIEFYNPNPFTLGLAGAHLSDNPANNVKWAFPAGTSIPPNGFLTVFASNKDRAVAGSPLHTNFELKKSGETLSFYGPGGTLWSRLPADYPATATYPAQYRDTSYGVDGAGNLRFFRPATPNAANAAVGYTTVVEDTSFSVKRGLYSTPQSVAITCATPGATIRYTVNGTKPTDSNGTIYSAPIAVSTTTAIRAAAFLAGAAPSNVDTHTYIFPASVASQPTMLPAITGNATWGPQIPDGLRDVPSISLVTPNTADIKDTAETEASFEFIHPTDATKSAHAGTGVDYFGGAFTSFTKKSFRLHFRGIYGDKKLKAPLFEGHEHGQHAVDEFDGLELRNGSHDMVDRGFYMSNIFTDQAMMEMGNLSPHGRFVHVYLNGTYWGLYHMRERWNAAMHASYLGGQTEDYEAINGNYNVGGWATPGQPFDGDGAAWEYAKSRRTNYAELRGLIDVGNYSDYMITWMFGNAEDEWRGVSPNRLVGPGSGSRFVINDSDGWLSVGSANTPAVWDGNDNNTGRASTWNGTTFTAGRTAGDGPGSIFAALVLTAGNDYKTLLADRIHRALFNNGPLTPTANAARLNALCTPVERAFIAEAARWNYRTPASWTTARNVCLNNWIPGRTATVLTQYRNAGLYPTLNAPVFSQNGGTFAPGFALGMTVTSPPAGSTIRYTLDGTDPRLPGGAAAPGALTWTANVPLSANTVVKARTLSPANEWSALQTGFFQLDSSSPVPPGAVVPSEIHFNPKDDDDAEFIELMNVSSAAVNLRGCRFTNGIDFAFSEYRDTLLAPGQRLVLVDSEFVHRARYGWDRTIDGIYFDNLNNDGEQITFVSGAVTVFDMSFSESWSPLADSGGRSLTLIHPRTGLNLSDPLNWRASQTDDGTPGTGDTGAAFSGTATADIDGDGATAFMEYAMGTSDTSAASIPDLSFAPGTTGSFQFVKAAAADDAVVIPELSTDLTAWTSGPSALATVSEESLPDGRIKVTVAPVPAAIVGVSHVYVRIKVTSR
ncbi:MAG TPA: chitobiase/beta-hexosaminidase C-terminal domain-containing protein, partial [Verrucomicrobiales bacterium]|nr:chitobiase/beta-hexosaminidase C-terminal domain-containing protein [Verrucomicrobiales bacterium]